MRFDEDISFDWLALASAALCRAGSSSDLRFKYSALRRLTRAFGSEEEIFDRWQVLAIVEDDAGFRSDSEIWALLESMHILEAVRGGYRLKARFTLGELFDEDARLPPDGIAIDFLDAFEQRLQERPATGFFALSRMIRQARQALLPLAETTRAAGLPAPTTFWLRDEKTGALVPWGNSPSTYTATDMVLTITVPWLMHPEIADLEAARRECLTASGFLDLCLALRGGPDHPRPGVVFVRDDDDYPGAELPTVPSNAVLLRALATEAAWRSRLDLPQRADLARIVAEVTAFVLDAQLPEGAWGVYRYDQHVVPPSAVLTGVVVNGLSLILPHLSAAMAERTRAALQRCAAFLDATIEQDPPGWRQDFDPHLTPNGPDTLEAALSRMTIARTLGEDATGLTAVRAALASAQERWNVHPEPSRNIHEVSMRPPQRERPSITKVTWEQPGHAKAVTLLLTANALYDACLSG